MPWIDWKTTAPNTAQAKSGQFELLIRPSKENERILCCQIRRKTPDGADELIEIHPRTCTRLQCQTFLEVRLAHIRSKMPQSDREPIPQSFADGENEQPTLF